MSIRHGLAFVVSVSALAMCIPSSLFADGVAGVSAGSANVHVGDTFNIPVSVSDVSDLFSFQFDLSFDPTILELQSISEGSFFQTRALLSSSPAPSTTRRAQLPSLRIR